MRNFSGLLTHRVVSCEHLAELAKAGVSVALAGKFGIRHVFPAAVFLNWQVRVIAFHIERHELFLYVPRGKEKKDGGS